MIDVLPRPTRDQIILRRDALADGCTDRELARLVRAGELHKLRHGAYTSGELWRSLGERERHQLLARAVLMQGRSAAVLSHVSAAMEYGVPTWGLDLRQVHVTRLDAKAGRNEAGVRQHQGVLLEEDVDRRHGVETTSATRTALDLTTMLEPEPALVAVNHLLHEVLTTAAALSARYASMGHHPHTLRTQLVLALADPRIESVGESRFFFGCWRGHVPRPAPQYVVLDELGRIYARLDFAWPHLGKWAEFDGRQKYLSHRRPGESIEDAVLREKRREDRVRELTGWRCIRITWADLSDWEQLAARLLAFLRS